MAADRYCRKHRVLRRLQCEVSPCTRVALMTDFLKLLRSSEDLPDRSGPSPRQLSLLHHGLAGILAFAALKMLAAHWIDIGPLHSLGIIAAILTITILLSLKLQKNTRTQPL